MQEWLINAWLDQVWSATIARVPAGDGFAEEALVNARVRNSAPRAANDAVQAPATNVVERIQRELDAYGKWNPATLQRRCRLLLRTVVLFRHFAGHEQLAGIHCPQQA